MDYVTTPTSAASSAQAPTIAVDASAFPNPEELRSTLRQEPSDLTFMCGLDVGTTKSSGVIKIVRKSEEATEGNVLSTPIVVLQDGNKSFRIPTKAAIIPQAWGKRLGEKDSCTMVFGHDVDKGLQDGTIDPSNVFDLIKYGLFSEYSSDGPGSRAVQTDPIVGEVRERHSSLCRKIQATYHGVVRVHDTLANEILEVKIKRIEDVMLAYLEFFRRCARLQIAEIMKIEPGRRHHRLIPRLQKVFEHESRVAASVPANWPPTVQDRFTVLLSRARFPKSKVIPSEASSAAVYKLNTILTRRDINGQDRNTLVCDVGGGYAQTVVLRNFVLDGNPRFGAIGPAQGSCNGSLQLNRMMELRLFEKLYPHLRRLLNSQQYAEFEKQIKDGIERTKQEFGNSNSRLWIETPIIGQITVRDRDRLELERLGLRFLHRELNLNVNDVEEPFDEWLVGIFELVQAAIDDFDKQHPNDSLRSMALCGWGALPPYVLQACKNQFRQLDVHLIENKTEPIIAQGNFATLVRKDLALDDVARNSYGIRYDMPDAEARELPGYHQLRDEEFSEDRDFLLDRPLWVVKKGDNLRSTDKNFCVQGRKRLTSTHPTSTFPFTWDIDVIVSGCHAVSGSTLSVRELEEDSQIVTVVRYSWVIRYADVKIHAAKSPFQNPFIEFDFRLRLDLEQPRPTLVVSIPPQGGEFTSPLNAEWREDIQGCFAQNIPLDHLYEHLNLQDNIEAMRDARGKEQIDEQPETDFDQGEDSEKEVRIGKIKKRQGAKEDRAPLRPGDWLKRRDAQGPQRRLASRLPDPSSHSE